MDELIEEEARQLANGECVPCEGGVAPLAQADAEQFHQQINSEWQLGPEKIVRNCKFNNFISAFEFASKVASLAETEGHHPDLHVGWGYLTIELTTHAAKGLTKNDFIVAAKIDSLEMSEGKK